MERLRIRTHPDPVLRKKSRPVTAVNEEERKLLGYMIETMYTNQGIGLAAVQVGVAKRIIVIDAGEGLIRIINPEIRSLGGVTPLEEGCLSLPGQHVEVRRPSKISCVFIDENNKKKEMNFSGLAAKAVQHEIDHLDGKLIIDYIPWFKRFLSKKGTVECLQ